MLLQDVLTTLKEKYNIEITAATLRNYREWELIPAHSRISLGRWKGTATDYPDCTIEEAYAAFQLLNGRIQSKPEHIKKARDTILRMEANTLPESEIPYHPLDEVLCKLWIYYREYARTETEYIFSFNGVHIIRIPLQ